MQNSQNQAEAIAALVRLMGNLRDPEHGCAWDRKQTLTSLTRHTLEEVYEVIDAIEQGNPEKICDELGDLLFQVVFYARIAQEQGLFDLQDVANAITQKLLVRHPHIFPDGTLDSFGQPTLLTAHEVEQNWEKIKNAQRVREGQGRLVSVMDDVASAMPALDRAAKLQKRAASVGFDWADISGVTAKLDEEVTELKQAVAAGSVSMQQHELGDLLFTCVNLARHLGLDADASLRDANKRFESRFKFIEQAAARSNTTLPECSSNVLEQWWQDAKRLET
ncbi:nucleoside triphosphate pyrophosphohydrolase [Gammaproteobacteria bacterium LSUCC0112]|nr:nucleoside triphosphate pyrophosphohydrolase [Gammaproteobacteria bacterium LSUCC0112]